MNRKVTVAIGSCEFLSMTKTILRLHVTDVQKTISISKELASMDTEKEATYGNYRQETHRGSRLNGQQGGAAARALRVGNQFKVRVLTGNPAKHGEFADEERTRALRIDGRASDRSSDFSKSSNHPEQ
jgi:hypothetical protein